eukprot:1873182-Amphidinium_carterae.1
MVIYLASLGVINFELALLSSQVSWQNSEFPQLLDCRPLADPQRRTRCTGFNGMVMKKLVDHERFLELATQGVTLLREALAKPGDEVVVGFVCRGGRHRSVAMACLMAVCLQYKADLGIGWKWCIVPDGLGFALFHMPRLCSSASSYKGASRIPRKPHDGPHPPSTPPPTRPSPSQGLVPLADAPVGMEGPTQRLLQRLREDVHTLPKAALRLLLTTIQERLAVADEEPAAGLPINQQRALDVGVVRHSVQWASWPWVEGGLYDRSPTSVVSLTDVARVMEGHKRNFTTRLNSYVLFVKFFSSNTDGEPPYGRAKWFKWAVALHEGSTEFELVQSLDWPTQNIELRSKAMCVLVFLAQDYKVWAASMNSNVDMLAQAFLNMRLAGVGTVHRASTADANSVGGVRPPALGLRCHVFDGSPTSDVHRDILWGLPVYDLQSNFTIGLPTYTLHYDFLLPTDALSCDVNRLHFLFDGLKMFWHQRGKFQMWLWILWLTYASLRTTTIESVTIGSVLFGSFDVHGIQRHLGIPRRGTLRRMWTSRTQHRDLP